MYEEQPTQIQETRRAVEQAGGEGRSTDHTLGLRRGQLCLQPPHQRTVGLEVVAAARHTVSPITPDAYLNIALT